MAQLDLVAAMSGLLWPASVTNTVCHSNLSHCYHNVCPTQVILTNVSSTSHCSKTRVFSFHHYTTNSNAMAISIDILCVSHCLIALCKIYSSKILICKYKPFFLIHVKEMVISMS